MLHVPWQASGSVVGWIILSLSPDGLFFRCSITITPDGTLIIRNISKLDEGKYTCFAENFMGKANSTGVLSVRGKGILLPLGPNVIMQGFLSFLPPGPTQGGWKLLRPQSQNSLISPITGLLSYPLPLQFVVLWLLLLLNIILSYFLISFSTSSGTFPSEEGALPSLPLASDFSLSHHARNNWGWL